MPAPVTPNDVLQHVITAGDWKRIPESTRHSVQLWASRGSIINRRVRTAMTILPGHIAAKLRAAIHQQMIADRSGGWFKRCEQHVAAKGGAYDPAAVCATVGRKKFGAKQFQAMSVEGRVKAAAKRRKSGAARHQVRAASWF